jgi:hypothetical protein
MRTALLSIALALLTLLQVTFPQSLAPWALVPDFGLLIVLALVLSAEPIYTLPWWALLVGFTLDLFQASHLGMWILACLAVVSAALVIRLRVLPRLTVPNVAVTSAVSLGLGLLVVFLGNRIGAGGSFGSAFTELARIYLPKLILDLLFVGPIFVLVRSLVRSLRRGEGLPQISTPTELGGRGRW